MRNLTRNAVRCKGCDTVIESRHRHDYRTCGCPNQTMVDGGLAYQRCGGKDLGLIEDLSEWSDDDIPDTNVLL